MKNDIYQNLKFKIGEESYDREFEIIPIPPYELLENGLSLEPYEYFGEINEIFGFKASQIILYYNADILMKVRVHFRGNIVSKIVKEIEGLNSNLPANLSLTVEHDKNEGLTVLIYQKSILTKKQK